ncbi:entry exclusion protein TrbK [Agrobacterium tumefaciens]|uniref:DUF2749 domain-containing protein n=1 Tax=Agrobacterium tumefaciens TaxID=358 RepID=UPI00080F9704|nr:entry exclusion protein TrbK [Agrobacterium tumefaciens]
MVRTKVILIAIATMLAATSAGIWFLISEQHDAQDRGAKFFDSSSDHPTSGGEKMKIGW